MSTGPGERDRALMRALERLERYEEEYRALPNSLHDALRQGESERYRALVLRRSTLNSDLAMARIEVKKIQLENFRAGVPDLEAVIERCERIAADTTAKRDALRLEWQRANDADLQARGNVQANMQSLSDLRQRIAEAGRELDRLMEAAMVTANEAA